MSAGPCPHAGERPALRSCFLSGGCQDRLLDCLVELHGETRAVIALLEARSEWSVKRAEFRNAAMFARINARARVYLSSTMLPSEHGPAFTQRACVLSFRTHERHVDACIEDVTAALFASTE